MRHFTVFTSIYDGFFPVPFFPSPSGFHRQVCRKKFARNIIFRAANLSQKKAPKLAPEIFEFFSACARLCWKNLCCASRFCTGGGGAAGSKSKQMFKGPWSKMLAQWHNVRLRDEGGGRGRSCIQDKTEDSQHMLNPPRGSFPDCLVGLKKSPKIPTKFPAKFAC